MGHLTVELDEESVKGMARARHAGLPGELGERIPFKPVRLRLRSDALLLPALSKNLGLKGLDVAVQRGKRVAPGQQLTPALLEKRNGRRPLLEHGLPLLTLRRLDQLRQTADLGHKRVERGKTLLHRRQQSRPPLPQ
jgi:hypothetical protein